MSGGGLCSFSVIVTSASCTHLRVVEQEQRELVDIVVDEVEDAPDKQFSSTVSITSAICIAINKFLRR